MKKKFLRELCEKIKSLLVKKMNGDIFLITMFFWI